MTMKPEYLEVIRPPFSVVALGLLIGGGALTLLVVTASVDPDAYTAVSTLVGAAAGLTAVVARLTISIDAERMRLRLWPFLTVTLRPADISAVQAVPIAPRALGGIGIGRTQGARVLTMGGGRGVLFTTTRGRVIVQSRDADLLVEQVRCFAGIT